MAMHKMYFFLFSMVFVIGCVAPQQFAEVKAERDYFKAEYESLLGIEQEKLNCQKEVRTLRADLKEAMRELEIVTVRAATLARDNARLQRQNESLIEQNEALLSTASYEKQALETQLAAKLDELDKKEAELQALEYVLDQKRQELEALAQTLQSKGMKVDVVVQWSAARAEELDALFSSLQARSGAYAGQPLEWTRSGNTAMDAVKICAPQTFFFYRQGRVRTEAINFINDLRALLAPFPDLVLEVEWPFTDQKEMAGMAALVVELQTLGMPLEQYRIVPQHGRAATSTSQAQMCLQVVPRWEGLASLLAQRQAER